MSCEIIVKTYGFAKALKLLHKTLDLQLHRVSTGIIYNGLGLD